MFALFTSEGLKRKIAALLSLVLGVVAMFPGAQPIKDAVQLIASLFGVTGLVHATAAHTLSQHTLAGLASAVSIIIALSHVFPQLLPIVGPLQYVATMLGAATVGSALSKTNP